MLNHDEFQEQKGQALTRIARLETRIQAQIDSSQGTISQLTDSAADGANDAADATGSVLGSIWGGVRGAASWVWDQVPGKDVMQAIARRAYNWALKEMESHGGAAGDVAADIHAIEKDPMGFAKRQWDARKARAVDPTKEHFEGPRGTMLADGLTWVLGQ